MSWVEELPYDTFRGLSMRELKMDEAWLNISAPTDIPLFLYQLSEDCHKCPYTLRGELNRSDYSAFKVNTVFPLKLRFRTEGTQRHILEHGDAATFCDIDSYRYGQYGVYDFHIQGNASSSNCDFYNASPPVNVYLPILLLFFLYVFLAIAVVVLQRNRETLTSFFCSKRLQAKREEREAVPPMPSYLINRRTSTPEALVHGLHLGAQQQTASTSGSEDANNTTASNLSIISSAPSSGNGSPNGNNGLETTKQVFTGITRTKSESTRTVQSRNTIAAPPIQLQQQQTSQRQRQRLRSLDTFRGICIVTMIFVNDGGGGYYFFSHATWDGLYIADLVFPWFLWIMGVCIPVSIKSQVKRGTSRIKIFAKIFSRSMKLIGLGLMLNSNYGPVNLTEFRIPTVLVRFGLCYFVGATLVLFCMTVNITKPDTSKFKAAVQDIGIIWVAWVIVLLLIVLHSLLTFMLDVPGCPTGYLGPGGINLFEKMENESFPYPNPAICIGGAAGFIDREIFTVKHMFNWPTAKSVYEADAYDPEGLLGTLTSILNVWLGVQTGATMLVYPRASSRLKRWAVWAVMTGAAGAALCGGQKTGGWIPLNKNLWSLSFVLVTSCFALTLLSILYVVIDMKKWWSGSPFFEPGMNSILLYVGHSVGSRLLPWHWAAKSMEFKHLPRLFEAAWATTLWVIIAIWLYFKKIFWKL